MTLPAPSKKPSPLPQLKIEKLEREKRFLVTQAEEARINRLVDRMAQELGTSLKLSHLVRACLRLLCESEAAIVAEAERMPPLHHLANGAIAEFEEQAQSA